MPQCLKIIYLGNIMQLTINGTSKEFSNTNTIADVVAQMIKEPKNIIAEINGVIVPANDWSTTPVKNGDTLELVTFVGGG